MIAVGERRVCVLDTLEDTGLFLSRIEYGDALKSIQLTKTVYLLD
jgi:hypothetical protein